MNILAVDVEAGVTPGASVLPVIMAICRIRTNRVSLGFFYATPLSDGIGGIAND